MTSLPLEGVTVLELGNYMAAPFCGMLLADLGADVLKVENPRGGDYSRALGPFPDGSRDGAGFLRVNRNKRSVALDLKRSEGRAAFLRLARRVDALVENFRPGTLDDLGVGQATLAAENPRLIHVAISGFGQEERARAGLDLIVQAESGLMSITGSTEGEPVKVGVPIADLTAALYAALAVTSCLRARDLGRGGSFVDVALVDAAVSLAVWESAVHWTTGEVPAPLGTAHRVDAPYQAFRTKDGRIAVGATSPPTWSAFLGATGLHRLETDEAWSAPSRRRERYRELAAIIEDVMCTRTTDEWFARLSSAGVPCGRIRAYDEVLSDPRLDARGLFLDLQHAALGSLRAVGSPLLIDGARSPRRVAGPELGEHTREVLREHGLPDGEIDGLIAGGAAFDARSRA